MSLSFIIWLSRKRKTTSIISSSSISTISRCCSSLTAAQLMTSTSSSTPMHVWTSLTKKYWRRAANTSARCIPSSIYRDSTPSLPSTPSPAWNFWQYSNKEALKNLMTKRWRTSSWSCISYIERNFTNLLKTCWRRINLAGSFMLSLIAWPRHTPSNDVYCQQENV